MLKGVIVEKDSSTVMPFVYVINKSNGNGTMSDNEGRFTLLTGDNDTLICSYIGYMRSYFPVAKLKRNDRGEVRLTLTPMPIALNAVTVNAFRFKPYEREYMQDIMEKNVNRSRVDYVRSPITALYMQYSKEGRQIRKLANIFEQLMIEEEVQKKLSREILVRLTGDQSIDYNAFRKYCYYVNDYFIVTHDGVDLYSKVMDCYRYWKAEGRDQPPRLRNPIPREPQKREETKNE
jgi:hypothetical protein